MKLHHYISALWAAILTMAATLTACSVHDDLGNALNPGGGDDDTMQIGINVVLPVMDGSRATYQSGDTYENKVNLEGNDYRLLLFSADDKTLVCSFEPKDVQYRFTNKAYYNICTIYAYVSEESVRSHTDFLLVMLANWGDYPTLTTGSTTIDDLAGYVAEYGVVTDGTATTFEASAQLLARDGNTIPMYGVKECNNVSWTNGQLTWLGDLWLLRSVAKIEVKTADPTLQIESVELTRYNALGTCAPRGVYSENTYVAGTDLYKPTNYVTLPGSKNDEREKNYLLSTQEGENGNTTFVVYVPEYQILSDYSRPQQPNADMPLLNIKFKGIDKTYTAEFKYYTDAAASDNDGKRGDYFDIRRNFIYRYNLHLANREIDCKVDVLPYTSVVMRPVFGLPLAGINLSRDVVYLYTNASEDEEPTNTYEIIEAIDENGVAIPFNEIDWWFDSDQIGEVLEADEEGFFHGTVCKIKEDEDGRCIVQSIPHARGRDVITATTHDHNGLEVTADLVVEVSTRHLGLDKTFLGIMPEEDDEDVEGSTGSFIGTVIAETDEECTLRWRLLNTDADNIDAADSFESKLTYLRDNIRVLVDGVEIENGATIGEVNTFEVKLQGGKFEGVANLWLEVDCPARNYTKGRTKYSTYCEILVKKPGISCYPNKPQVVAGQTASISAIITPSFSDYFPQVKYHSFNEGIVTVDDNGLIYGIAPGEVKVVAYNDTDFPHIISDTVTVTVEPNNLVLKRDDYPGVVADYIELLRGESVKINAMSGDTIISGNVTWSIEEKNAQIDEQDKNARVFISVSNDGTVTANRVVASLGSNTVVATYKVGGKTLTQKCTIVCSDTRKLIINEQKSYVTEDAQIPLTASFFPDKRPQDQRNDVITWTCDSPEVMSISNTKGIYYGVAEKSGTTIIRASATYPGESTVRNASMVVNVGDIEDQYKEVEYDGTIAIDDTFSKDSDFEGSDNDVHTKITSRQLSRVTIPNGKTYKVVVKMNDVKSVTAKQHIRFSYHEDRIEINKIDNKTITIKSKANDTIDTRYNEVILTITFKDGTTDVRRFAVFSI